jgi:hypothetical protein
VAGYLYVKTDFESPLGSDGKVGSQLIPGADLEEMIIPKLPVCPM